MANVQFLNVKKLFTKIITAIKNLQTSIVNYFHYSIAPVELDLVADRAYSTGDYLIYNKSLYRVIADIAINNNLVIGTNITSTSTTVGAKLKQLETTLGTKQNTLTFDSAPISESTNPVTSGGLYTYISNKAANTNPIMDSTADPGEATTFSRSDHVHPSDNSKLNASAVVNNLTTEESGYALDARQGKTLSDSISALDNSKLNASAVVNNLTTTESGYALDARQGKTLSDSISALDTFYKLKHNDYTDITADFNEGVFSNNLSNYSPGNYIKKTYSGTTYVAVLADYNTFYSPGRSDYANINVNHWTAIVFGFSAGQMNTSNTTANGFTGSAMNTWLKGDCTTAVQGAFGSAHLKAHSCLLSTGTYSSSSATHGFSWAWESGHYTMLMSQAQLGYRAWSDLGWSTGEAHKPLQIFLNEPFMSVFHRNYGQSNASTGAVWLRDISAISPGTYFCLANNSGLASYSDASNSLGRLPLIVLI